MKNHRRHGDVNLHEISEAEYNALTGKVLKHNGSYILAEGEATNSVHEIKVKDKKNLEIKQVDIGRVAIAIKNEEATVTHTHDHETIIAPKKTFYIQVPEREVDHYADSVERKVID